VKWYDSVEASSLEDVLFITKGTIEFKNSEPVFCGLTEEGGFPDVA